MNWKRYFRFRHFYHSISFLLHDSFLSAKKVSVQPKTLLIVRLEAIGDYLFVRNFLALTRKSEKFKDYTITLCGNELWRDLAEHFDAESVDEFIWINKKKFGKENEYRNAVLNQIRSKGFEYAIQPNFSRELLWGDSVIRASGATHRIGSVGDMANDLGVFKLISDQWFTRLIKDNSQVVFEFERNKIFFEQVLEEKISLIKPAIEISNKSTGDYVVLFPGAGEKIKQWDTKNFAAWIKLFRQTETREIYICGAPSDNALAEEIINASNGATGLINYCGKTNLPQLIEFISSCALLITNDSSAFHIGAAQDVPTICLLMGRHYGRFAPYPEESCRNLITLYPKRFVEDLKSNPNMVEEMKFSSPYDINEIEVLEVLDASKQLLS